MPDTDKLSFDDQRSVQLVLGSASDGGRAAAELERATGVRVHVRGTEVSLSGGDEAGRSLCRRVLEQLLDAARRGRPVDPYDLGRAIEVVKADPEGELSTVFDDTLLARNGQRKAVGPRSAAQKRYVDAMRRNHLVFGVGPAGTGKTFLAVAMAVRRLLDKQVRRLVLTRPAIEAGESLGFLPGTAEEKVSPYMRPLYDALFELLDPPKVHRMMEQGVIEIAPLAYMRGRTLSDSFVIMDEAQNATIQQTKMLLTRIGTGTWCVVTGDPSQADLGRGVASGLPHALDVLRGVQGIVQCRFTAKDVMRHPLVQSIIRAYDAAAQGGDESK